MPIRSLTANRNLCLQPIQYGRFGLFEVRKRQDVLGRTLFLGSLDIGEASFAVVPQDVRNSALRRHSGPILRPVGNRDCMESSVATVGDRFGTARMIRPAVMIIATIFIWLEAPVYSQRRSATTEKRGNLGSVLRASPEWS
jgi:hypothetical protein